MALLLLFFQGSYAAPFSDVPILNTPGRRKRHEPQPEAIVADFVPLERQVRVAQAREVDAKGVLATLQARALLEAANKATATRRANALTKQVAAVAQLAAVIDDLNAAMAVEREETDLIFVLSIMSEV